jgi:NTE family protein
VLQGGGALGAYQAGVFEGLTEAGYTPDWVTGVSIGAINGALIAGNPPERRIERLREFWELVSSGAAWFPPSVFEPVHRTVKRASAAMSASFGVPGFFVPRLPPALLAPHGSDWSLSVYDTSPLKDTLEKLIDFELINTPEVRFSVGAANVRSGNSEYFDNRNTRIQVEHVMASGALPPAFAPVQIDDEFYWDGGIVSNTPLWYVLDDSPQVCALIFQVDLFNARGDLPGNLEEVMERHKDIIYSSKTRFNTTRVRELRSLRRAVHRLLEKLPESLRSDEDVKLLGDMCCDRHIDIVHLINRRPSHAMHAKDYEFSRSTVRDLWDLGLNDMRRTIAHPEWLRGQNFGDGVRVYDLCSGGTGSVPGAAKEISA